MNGLFSKNILVRESDDIYVPFEYELMHDIPKNSIEKNIIIDSRCEKIILKEIYEKGKEVLIYNTTRHKIINIYQYFEDVMGITKTILSLNKIKKICLITLIIKYCFKKLNINCDIRYILQKIDNTEFLKMDIIGNLATISMKDNDIKISSKKYDEIKSKIMNFEKIDENINTIKSFIILYSNETIKV